MHGSGVYVLHKRHTAHCFVNYCGDEMAVQLERFLPTPEAARRLRIGVEALNRLIDSGIIKAVQLNGVVAVSESELRQTITREQFGRLRGREISVSEAVKEYRINAVTIRRWVERGLIRVLKEGYGMELDLADVAYCAAVYKALGGARGKRLFDDEGNPYQLKKTEWAAYQRERRKRLKKR